MLENRNQSLPYWELRTKLHWSMFFVFLACSAALSSMLVAKAATAFGPGLTPDSIDYIEVAKTLLERRGFMLREEPLTLWPPLFPCILALFGISGAESLPPAVLLNAAVLGGIVMCAGLLGLLLTRSAWWVAASVLATLCSAPIFRASIMVWSEPIFILLTLLALISATEAELKPQPRLWAVAFICASLASLQRYLGVVTIVAVAAAFLGAEFRRERKIAGKSLALCLASFIPLALWFGRNLMIAGTLSGTREASSLGLLENLTAIFGGLASWLWGPLRSPLFGTFFCAVLVCGVLASSVWRAFRGAGYLLPTTLFAVFYLVLLLLARSLIAADEISQRLLAPLYVPLVLLSFSAIRDAGSGKSRAQQIGFVVLVCVWLAGAALSLEREFDRAVRLGPGGYTTLQWRESQTLRALKAEPRGLVVYSNAPELVSFFGGLRSYWLPTTSEDLMALRARNAEPSEIVVFTRHWRKASRDLISFSSAMASSVRQFSDGYILRLQ